MADNFSSRDATGAARDLAAKEVAGALIPRNILTTADGTGDVDPVDAAQLPASLGAKAAAASMSTVPAVLSRTTIMAARTTTGQDATVYADAGLVPTFHATVAGTGAVSATILILGRNASGGAWATLATITLSGTTSATDMYLAAGRCMEYAASLTAVSGTGAAATVVVGG